MKKLKRILCAMLSVCMIMLPVSSAAVGAEDNIDDLKKKLSELEAKSAQYQAELDKTKADIKDKEAYSQALIGKIGTLDEKIALTGGSIQELNSDITTKQGEINEANKAIESQLDALCSRLRTIYMSGSASDLEIILGAKDFSDFVDKMTLVQTLSTYDKELIDDVNEQLSKIAVQKEELETDKDDLEEKQTTLQEDQQELNDLLDENEEFLRGLYESSEDAKKAIEGAAIESADAESKIAAYYEAQRQKAALEAQKAAETIAAERAKAAEQSSRKTEEKPTEPEDEPEETQPAESSESDDSSDSSYTPSIPSSGYTWPTPGYYFVISKWNEDRGSYNHGAIDITGSGIMGQVVVAAQSGTVIDTYNSCPHNYGKDGSCGCNGGFGNYVVIDHGNGKSTLYAHLTNGIVSTGQTVSQGQVIGFVGSTGWSTGAHLHFETRYYGVRYNPHDEYPNMDF